MNCRTSLRLLTLPLLLVAARVFCQPVGCDFPIIAQYHDQTCVTCTGLDGYVGQLNEAEVGEPMPGFCTDWLKNQNYMGFMAGSEQIEMEFRVFGCDICCGIEVGVYKLDDFQNPILISDSCNTSVPNNGKWILTNNARPYEVGGCYFLVFDSNGAGKDCKFRINVLKGSTLPPDWQDSGPMDGPREVCPGGSATYSIPKLPCFRVHDWFLDGTPLGRTDHVDLSFPAPGTYQLCSKASGICHDIPSTCIDIVVPQPPTIERFFEACAGDTIRVDGFKFFETGIFPKPYQTALGCDSVVRYHINMLPAPRTELAETICFGKTTQFFGQTLDATGKYEQRTKMPNSDCDSVVILNLTVLPESKSERSEQICFGKNFLFGNQIFDATGDYPVVFQNSAGCDSTVLLRLQVLPESKSDLAATVCFGEKFALGSQQFAQSGNFQVVFTDHEGCDSTVYLNLTVLPESKSDLAATICYGEKFALGGQEFAAAGNFSVKLQNAAGCDSTVNLTLKIRPEAKSAIASTICFGEKFEVGGQQFSQTGDFKIVVKNTAGCDSTIDLSLVVRPLPASDLPATVCFGEKFSLGGQQFSQSGKYDVVFKNAAVGGCDSLVRLDLTVLPESKSELPAVVCFGEKFQYGGQEFSQTGNFPIVLKNAAGCDSTVSLQLTVLPEAKLELTETICFGKKFELAGQEFAQAGDFTVVVPNASGCDSTIFLKLKIRPEAKSALDATICFGEKFELGGKEFSQAGDFQVVVPNAAGCDSTIFLSLKIRPEAKSALDATICFGEKFELGGKEFSQAGDFQVVVPNAAGCDSTIFLNLKIRPEAKSALDATICFGEKFELGGQEFSQAGKFKVKFQNSAGCDSTVNLQLKILPEAKSEVEAKICLGENFELGGQQFSSAGVYKILTKNALGCDSSILLELKTFICEFDLDTAVAPATCFGFDDGSVRLGVLVGNPPVDYFLEKSGSTNPIRSGTLPTLPADIVLGGLRAGDYDLRLSDAEGLRDTISLTVGQPDPLILDIGSDLDVDFGQPIVLQPTANFQISMAEWQPANLFTCPTCPVGATDSLRQSGWIWLTASDPRGCRATDSLLVRVDDEPLVFVPNVFAPASGENGRLPVFGNFMVKNVRDFRVFDRWGEAVFVLENFAPNDPFTGWDGRFRGRDAAAGVFVWFAEIELLDGRVLHREGDVLVVR